MYTNTFRTYNTDEVDIKNRIPVLGGAVVFTKKFINTPLKDKESIKDYCLKYWLIEEKSVGKRGSEISFKYSVSAIQAMLNLKIKPMYDYCYFISSVNCYMGCGKKYFAKNRTDLIYSTKDSVRDKFICDDCEEDRRNLENLKKEEDKQREIIRLEKVNKELEEKFNFAMESSTYLNLSDLEYNLWIELAGAKECASEAYRKVGISDSYGKKIFESLGKKNLILFTYDETKKRFFSFGDYSEAIKNAKKINKTKSIFANSKEANLFQDLKRENLFVYPKILLREFINIEDLKNEFESPDWNYLLYANVDFLICDKNGNPLSAVEYNGSYHENDDIKRKDEIKKKTLEYVGIPLRIFNNKGEKIDDILSIEEGALL